MELNSNPIIRHKTTLWHELKLQHGGALGRCRVGGAKTTPRGAKRRRKRSPSWKARFPKTISKWGRGR